MKRTSNIRLQTGAFILLGFLALAARWCDLDMPLERDEGEYAFAAQAIGRGDIPYRDTFCQKPPVVFLWYLAAFRVFGETARGIHLMLVVAAWLAAHALFLVLRRFLSPRDALLGAILFSLAAAGESYFGSAANTEILMLGPLLYGLNCVLAATQTGQPALWLCGGALVSGAFMTKQVAAFSVVGPLLYAAAVLAHRERALRPLVKPALLGVLGTSLVLLPIGAWFAHRGALDAMLEVAFRNNVDYVASGFDTAKMVRVWRVFQDRFLLSSGMLWLSALAGLLRLLTPRGRKCAALWFAAAWLLPSCAGAVLGPYVFGHYFLQVLPPLVLMLGLVADLLTGTRRRLGTVAVATLWALALFLPARERARAAGEPVDDRCTRVYGVYGPTPFVAAVGLGQYLASVTAPAERILIVGSEPELLFYAKRRSTTRYTIFYPLTAALPRSDAMLAEFYEECARRPPKAVVVCYCPSSFITGGRSTHKTREVFAHVDRMLRKGYVADRSVTCDSEDRLAWLAGGTVPSDGRTILFEVYVQQPGG